MLSLDKVFNAQTVLKNIVRETKLVRAFGIAPEFVKNVKSGDVMVAGWNFGCGSSREHAPLVIKTCGTGCVIANSFARIFYRNAINIGLPILECEAAAEEIKVNDVVNVAFDTGIISDITTGKSNQAQLSFDMSREADAIENAVSTYLDAGYRTADIMSEGMTLVGCKQCGELIIEYLRKG